MNHFSTVSSPPFLALLWECFGIVIEIQIYLYDALVLWKKWLSNVIFVFVVLACLFIMYNI